MADKDELEQIVESASGLGNIGAMAPDGFMVLIGADRSRSRISRIEFMEHTNAVADVLRDPESEVARALDQAAELEPLARRVVLGAVYQHFRIGCWIAACWRLCR